MLDINNESEFENHIRQDIISNLLSTKEIFKLFNFKKAVDILIAKNGISPKLFFIEIKYHKKNHGRLGFGQGKGAGFQPEVLKVKSGDAYTCFPPNKVNKTLVFRICVFSIVKISLSTIIISANLPTSKLPVLSSCRIT